MKYWHEDFVQLKTNRRANHSTEVFSVPVSYSSMRMFLLLVTAVNARLYILYVCIMPTDIAHCDISPKFPVF